MNSVWTVVKRSNIHLQKDEVKDPYFSNEIVISTLKKMNIEVNSVSYVSSGANGSAYRSTELPGKIIKLQKMKRQLAISFMRDYKKILNKKPKHIVKIFEVGYVEQETQGTDEYYDKDYVAPGYVILIREELNSIWRDIGTYSDTADIIMGMEDLPDFDDFNNKSLDLLSTRDLLKWMVEHSSQFGNTFRHMSQFNIDELFPKETDLQIFHDVYEGLKEARNLGIKAFDIFIKNVMYDPKQKIFKLLEIK